MTEFINAKELLKRWDIKDFELIRFLNQCLWPYDRYGRKIVEPEDATLPDKTLSFSLGDEFEDPGLFVLGTFQLSMRTELAEKQLATILTWQFRKEEVIEFEQEHAGHNLFTVANEATSSEPMAEIQKQKNANTATGTFRAYAQAVIDTTQAANKELPTRAGLAEQTLNAFPNMTNPKTGKPYDVRTVIDWIRDLFPDFSPLTPGAKKKN